MTQSGFFTCLKNRAVFSLSGKDAVSFLQGLVTADIEALTSGGATHAGLLTPQGKIMFDFFVFKDADRLLVDVAADRLDELTKRLTFYKLRADVDLTSLPEKAVGAVWGNSVDIPGADAIFADPRLTEMGWRVIAERQTLLSKENASIGDYVAHRLKLGIPDSQEIGHSETFPHEANFDQLGGVSFKKGCYVGQEVVSRMQHRGTARSRIIPVKFNNGTPAEKSQINAGDKKVGQILSAVNGRGLAMVRLDRASSAIDAGTPLEAEGAEVRLIKPHWAQFDMQEN